MKNNIIILITFVFYLTLNSCQQQITLDLPNSSPMLVVQGEILTGQDSSYVLLTKSVSYFTLDIAPMIDNAIVTVNGITFKNRGNGLYKPDSGTFTPTLNTQYNLNINYNGSTYTAATFLDQMFDVDHMDSVFVESQGGGGGPGRPRTGYSVRMWWTDTRTVGKYTYMRFGHTLVDFQQDTFLRNIVLLNNGETKLNSEISYQLPRRYQPGDSVFVILKSCDYNMYYFLQCYRTQTSSPPGPFQTPPANLPTNIRGGAIGYFVASDVRRYWKPL